MFQSYFLAAPHEIAVCSRPTIILQERRFHARPYHARLYRSGAQPVLSMEQQYFYLASSMIQNEICRENMRICFSFRCSTCFIRGDQRRPSWNHLHGLKCLDEFFCNSSWQFTCSTFRCRYEFRRLGPSWLFFGVVFGKVTPASMVNLSVFGVFDTKARDRGMDRLIASTHTTRRFWSLAPSRTPRRLQNR